MILGKPTLVDGEVGSCVRGYREINFTVEF
jgi:hypothetical protein